MPGLWQFHGAQDDREYLPLQHPWVTGESRWALAVLAEDGTFGEGRYFLPEGQCHGKPVYGKEGKEGKERKERKEGFASEHRLMKLYSTYAIQRLP